MEYYLKSLIHYQEEEINKLKKELTKFSAVEIPEDQSLINYVDIGYVVKINNEYYQLIERNLAKQTVTIKLVNRETR